MGARRFALAAIGLSVALRLIVLSVSLDRIPPGDSTVYFGMVSLMLDGHGMVFNDSILGTVYAQYPPLFPLLLYLASLIGGINPATISVLNFAFDLGTAAGIIWLGRLCGVRGWLPAAIYLCWPTNVLLSPMAQKEQLVSLLVVLSFCALLETSRRDRFAPLFGVLSGLLILSQPALSALPAIAALMVRRDGRWIRLMALSALCAVVVMIPWWVRNWLVLGAFIPLTSLSGLGLWIAAVPWGNGTWVPLRPHLVRADELATNAAVFADAWRYIAADPLGYLARSLAKVGRAFAGDLWPADSLDYRRRGLGWIGVVTDLLPVFLYAAAAISVIRRKSLAVTLLTACLANVLLFQFWFEFSERHRYYLTPLLLIVALTQSSSKLRCSPRTDRPSSSNPSAQRQTS